MDRAEYEKLKKQAELDYRQNLAAIERTWRLYRQFLINEEPADASVEETKAEERTSATINGMENRVKGNLIEAVRVVIVNYTAGFTILQVESDLKQRYPSWEIKRVSVHATLMRLVEKGDLEIAIRGSGRRPTTYRRK